MKKLKLTLLFAIFFFAGARSQTKIICGDTALYYNWYRSTQHRFGLKDLTTSTDDFNFRFRNHGQFVEINKNGDSVSGVLTNYIFWSKPGKLKKDSTILEKIPLKPSEAEAAFMILQNSKLPDMPTDKEISGWRQGCDGITYEMEFANRDTLWLKSYWTPSAQDSLPEALVVIYFVKSLSDTLHLSESYSRFQEHLPKKGCYTSGGLGKTCFASYHAFQLGYFGSLKLPLGYYASVYVMRLGKLKTNFNVYVSHQLDGKGNYDFSSSLGKGGTFKGSKDKKSFYVAYTYRRRELNFISKGVIYQNHSIIYGQGLFRSVHAFAGIDYLTDGRHDKTGVLVLAKKWFLKPKINVYAQASIFSGETDFKTGITKSFNFNGRFPVKPSSIGVYAERFKSYTGLNFFAVVEI